MILAKCLVYGDSICNRYRHLVREKLEGKIYVRGCPDRSGSWSGKHLENFKRWYIDMRPDMVHFNAGLHDMKIFQTHERWLESRSRPDCEELYGYPHESTFEYDTPYRKCPIDMYTLILNKLVSRIKAETTARVIIFATSTPIRDDKHNVNPVIFRYERDAIKYNDAAVEIMVKHGVIINDLHGLIIENDIEKCVSGDGAHLTDFGNELVSNRICEVILQNAPPDPYAV